MSLSPFYWRAFRRDDTLSRSIVHHMADVNAQFQTKAIPEHSLADRLCWGIVIVGLAIGLFWVLINAPASFFHPLIGTR